LGRAEAGFLIGRKGVVSLTSVGNDIQVYPPHPLLGDCPPRPYLPITPLTHPLGAVAGLVVRQALVSVTTDKRYKNLERDLRDIADR
jgi:hypothetical protein